MEKIVRINFSENLDFYDPYSFEYLEEIDELVMSINVLAFDNELSFNELIGNKEQIQQIIDEYNYTGVYEFKIDKYEEFIKEVKLIELVNSDLSTLDKEAEFIEKNKDQLESYELVIHEKDDIKAFMENRDASKYWICFKDSFSRNRYDDYLRIQNEFYETINNIKSLKLSSLENIVLISDLVRGKPYVEESTSNFTDSRCIWNILYNDKIVCSGYINLFIAMLEEFNIRANYLSMRANGQHHSYSNLYVEDSKYNVSGIFFSDITAIRKETKNDFSYLYNYFSFLKSYNIFDFIYTRVFDCEKGNKYKLIGNCFEYDASSILDFLKKKNPSIINRDNAIGVLKEFLYLIYGIDAEHYSENEIIKLVEERRKKIDSVTSKDIDAEIFTRLLAEVRYIENYCDPKKYPFDLERILDNYDKNLFADHDLENLIILRKHLSKKYQGNKEKIKKVDLTLYRYNK